MASLPRKPRPAITARFPCRYNERMPGSDESVQSKSFGRLVLYALTFLGVYLSYQVLSPFFVALAWAVMFGILFRGMYAALAPRTGPNGAALITTLVVGLVIVAPAVGLISALAQEAPQAIDSLKQASQNAPRQIREIWDSARALSPIAMPEDPTDLMMDGAQRALAYLAPRAGGVVADFFPPLGSLVAMLFALFFLLRDGAAISRHFRDLLPFPQEESERLMTDTRDL